MTAAQRKNQATFKKAIAYRKKTGCTLKQAFAYAKGGKVAGLEKVVKKGSKTSVIYSKKVKKKAAKKKATPKQGVLFGVKKKAAKKKATSYHKDTASHNVNIRVVSGINYNDPVLIMKEIEFWQKQLDKLRAEYKSPERKMYKSSIMADIRLSKKWLENYKQKLKLIISKIK